MREILTSITALLTATFFVQVSNAAITTMIAIVVAKTGGTQGDVAFIAAMYSIGFLAGCFVSPSQIQRLGFIRAFTAAAAILTITIIALDLTDRVGMWAFLRFSMGAAMAAVLAIADGWLNNKTPNEQRGRVIAIYSIVLGLASMLSQVIFFVMDAESQGFALFFAIAMNLSVVLVAVTSSMAPDTKMKPRKSWRSLSSTSVTANVGAFASGFITTSFVSILPFYLTKHGVTENLVALLLLVTYSGRLLFQWPIGLMSDHIGRRKVLMGISGGILVLMIGSLIFAEGEGRVLGGNEGILLQVMAMLTLFCLGGLMWPVYSISSALAFDRAEETTLVDVSVTLLVINSLGSIVGPFTVMFMTGIIGYYALAATIFFASAITFSVAIIRARKVEEEDDSKPKSIPVPNSSIEMVQTVAEVVEERREEIAMEEASGDNDHMR